MRYLLLLLPLLLLGNQIDLSWLSSKPTSIAKDYYIWRYLHQDIDCSQATKALQQAKNVNRKLFFAYAKKCPGPIAKIASCMRMSAKELLAQDPSCAAAGMNSYKLSTLTTQEIETFLQKTKGFAPPSNAKLLLAKDLTPIQRMRLFNSSASKIRKKLDRYFTKKQIESLHKTPGFRSFLQRIVFSETYKKLPVSLLLLDPKDLDAKSSFYLALQAMKFNLPYTATNYLQRARRAYLQEDRDKALFWLYRLSGDKNYLKELANSWDINIYSLYAKEEIGIEPDFIIPEATGSVDLNMSDPFLWNELVRKDLEKERFFHQNTLAIYAYLLEKRSHYRLHPFILPYKEYLKDQNTTQKALIYALARQESRFFPGSISHSYALGLMQFMPFLARHYAKKLGMEGFDLDMMFTPSIALRFAKEHLDYLWKQLNDPMLIAYAYNAGIGFTKRKVLPLFKKYDPFLAMELVPYSESRKYAKRVMANYTIYRKILNEPLSLHHYFENLSERFQNRDAKE